MSHSYFNEDYLLCYEEQDIRTVDFKNVKQNKKNKLSKLNRSLMKLADNIALKIGGEAKHSKWSDNRVPKINPYMIAYIYPKDNANKIAFCVVIHQEDLSFELKLHSSKNENSDEVNDEIAEKFGVHICEFDNLIEQEESDLLDSCVEAIEKHMKECYA